MAQGGVHRGREALPPSSLTSGQGRGWWAERQPGPGDRTWEGRVGRGPGSSREAQHQSC